VTQRDVVQLLPAADVIPLGRVSGLTTGLCPSLFTLVG